VLQASAVMPVLVVYGLFDRLQGDAFDLSHHGIQVRYSPGQIAMLGRKRGLSLTRHQFGHGLPPRPIQPQAGS